MRCIAVVRLTAPAGMTGAKVRAVPEIQFFDVHAVVDNDAHTSRIDAAA